MKNIVHLLDLTEIQNNMHACMENTYFFFYYCFNPNRHSYSPGIKLSLMKTLLIRKLLIGAGGIGSQGICTGELLVTDRKQDKVY